MPRISFTNLFPSLSRFAQPSGSASTSVAARPARKLQKKPRPTRSVRSEPLPERPAAPQTHGRSGSFNMLLDALRRPIASSNASQRSKSNSIGSVTSSVRTATSQAFRSITDSLREEPEPLSPDFRKRLVDTTMEVSHRYHIPLFTHEVVDALIQRGDIDLLGKATVQGGISNRKLAAAAAAAAQDYAHANDLILWPHRNIPIPQRAVTHRVRRLRLVPEAMMQRFVDHLDSRFQPEYLTPQTLRLDNWVHESRQRPISTDWDKLITARPDQLNALLRDPLK